MTNQQQQHKPDALASSLPRNPPLKRSAATLWKKKGRNENKQNSNKQRFQFFSEKNYRASQDRWKRRSSRRRTEDGSIWQWPEKRGRWGTHRESKSRPIAPIHSTCWSMRNSSRNEEAYDRRIRRPELRRSRPSSRTASPSRPMADPKLLARPGRMETVTPWLEPPWFWNFFLVFFFPSYLVFWGNKQDRGRVGE